jgi:hypothetical protein
LVFKRKDEHLPTRKPISREALEESLTEAVRASHPEFDTFAGVIVERIAPPTRGASNWTVKGVRYGRVDRYRGGIILSHCVGEAQLEFELSE